MNSHTLPDPDLLIVRVPGDLVSTGAQSLRREIDLLLPPAGGAAPPWHTLRLDLSKAKMIDSVGLNLIVGLFKRLQARGLKLQIAYADPNVFRTLTFTRLDQHIELVND